MHPHASPPQPSPPFTVKPPSDRGRCRAIARKILVRRMCTNRTLGVRTRPPDQGVAFLHLPTPATRATMRPSGAARPSAPHPTGGRTPGQVGAGGRRGRTGEVTAQHPQGGAAQQSPVRIGQRSAPFRGAPARRPPSSARPEAPACPIGHSRPCGRDGIDLRDRRTTLSVARPESRQSRESWSAVAAPGVRTRSDPVVVPRDFAESLVARRPAPARACPRPGPAPTAPLRRTRAAPGARR